MTEFRTQDDGSHAPAPDATMIFGQRPKPYSAELELKLTATHFIAERGRSRQEFPLHAIERIRLRFTPKNSVFKAFTCEVRAKDGKSIRFENVSWKSLIETERLDGDYTRFVKALVERTARANRQVELNAGITRFRYQGMLVIGGAMLLGLGACMVYALMQGSLFVGLMAVGLVGYLGFWLKEYATRNRPRLFTPEALPATLLPG